MSEEQDAGYYNGGDGKMDARTALFHELRSAFCLSFYVYHCSDGIMETPYTYAPIPLPCVDDALFIQQSESADGSGMGRLVKLDDLSDAAISEIGFWLENGYRDMMAVWSEMMEGFDQ